ncbi:multidrug resistance-associated protein 1 [Striga asiatica]|uniref:Multidrug resistance-associated protein 1 n=1 Tax=Striga asiatica TaxID=4170 RepID=A0A5A7NX70_STRAF|nr:multidrug resistance-associated protein 1 [Striga asiatica]
MYISKLAHKLNPPFLLLLNLHLTEMRIQKEKKRRVHAEYIYLSFFFSRYLCSEAFLPEGPSTNLKKDEIYKNKILMEALWSSLEKSSEICLPGVPSRSMILSSPIVSELSLMFAAKTFERKTPRMVRAFGSPSEGCSILASFSCSSENSSGLAAMCIIARA